MNPIILEASRIWRGSHRGISFKIVSWSFRSSAMTEWPSGNWNFYIYLPEVRCRDFKSLWLRGKRMRAGPGCPERLTHDYYRGPCGSIELHGGITYYQKHGHDKGHRCVEVGCDYQHLYDEGHHYDEQDVASDAVRAIDSCYELGILNPESSGQQQQQQP